MRKSAYFINNIDKFFVVTLKSRIIKLVKNANIGTAGRQRVAALQADRATDVSVLWPNWQTVLPLAIKGSVERAPCTCACVEQP